MALNEEKNLHHLINFEDGGLGEYLDEMYLMDFDDSESDKGCEDIADLLPKDLLDMDFSKGLPNDPFCVDFNVILPRDPFGMDFNMEAIEAITGLMEDFSLSYYGFFAVEDDSNDDKNLKVAEDSNCNGDNNFIAELNFVWRGSMSYDQEDQENEVGDSGPIMYTEDGSSNDLMCFGCEKYEIEEHVKDDRDGDGGSAADMIIFVIGYLDLGVKDLLSVERVCKPLHDAVRKDPYLWTKIQIDYALSQKIIDDDLLRLTDRAQGKLHSLSLVNCFKITNDGLKQVLERNLGLTKLSVAGSIRLGVEGVLQNLKSFNSVAVPGIKCLRIGKPFGLTDDHVKEFKLLLGADDTNPSTYKPRFLRDGEKYLSLDDERPIDVERCPRCQNLGQVYDCPIENCQTKMNSQKTCRACTSCIARCIRCGCCFEDKGYVEGFFINYLCFDCIFRFQDGMTSYHIFLYG